MLILSSWRAEPGICNSVLTLYLKNIDFELLAGWAWKSRFSIESLFKEYYFWAPGGLGPEIEIFYWILIKKILILSSWRAEAGNRDFPLNPYLKNIDFELLAGRAWKSWFSIESLFKKY